MRPSTSANQARGSTSFKRAVTMSKSIAAARSPPQSDPANSQCLPPQGNSAKRPFRYVIAQANITIVEEAAESRPPLQHIVRRAGDIGMRESLARVVRIQSSR
jgi:hypothetical protein